MITPEFLEITAAICPDRVAVIFEGQRVTYERLSERVKRLAAALATLGVAQGDTIALLQVNTPHCIETYFAAATLGAIFVPLNFRARPNELEYMINTAEAKVVLVETMRAVGDIEGVAGVHLMGYRNDEVLAEAIAESGIRRRVNTRAA